MAYHIAKHVHIIAEHVAIILRKFLASHVKQLKIW